MEIVTISGFVKAHKIEMEKQWVEKRPDGLMNEKMNHYKCTLKMGPKRMTLYFSQGLGINEEPKPEDVLNCLFSDATGIEGCKDAIDFMDEYGYQDPKESRKIYKAIIHQSKRLGQFLGEYLNEGLNTERL